MISALLVGSLCSLAALAILLPFLSGSRSRELGVADPDEDLRGELLRQLRDLDEDLAEGKILETDHRRLREPVEREAAAVLAVGGPTRGDRPRDPAPGGARAPRGRSRRSTVARVTSGVAMLAAAATGVAVLLLDAVDPRPAGSPVAVERAVPDAPGSGAVRTPGTSLRPSVDPPTDEEIAEVKAAVARVTRSPKNVVAHLCLARAYADAGQRQLSTIEYLAVTQLRPGHPEASTALALVAFTGGEVAQARDLVDAVLEAHPGHPEALYARGVIQLMGLDRPQEARRDLEAYLAAAPYGSHREAVDTLLQIIDGRRTR